ncbi:DENN protein [Hirschfeldia incana]|nr:DENN protein [Hirschfeldia incana]
MQGDVLAIHRGDGSRDDFLRYPKKKMDVEDQCKSESFRDGDEDGWRASSRDEEHDQNNLEEIPSISREEVGGTLRRNENGQGHVVVERDGLETKDGENDEQITSRRNVCSSPKVVDALEDKHDSLKASSDEEVGFCSSESVKIEDGDESLKQHEPLERVNKDEEEQVVLETDENVLGSVSRDNEESGSGSPEKDGINTLSREVIKELDTKASNGHLNGDLGKDGEDKSSEVLGEKDGEPQVDNTVIRKIEMRDVTGEQEDSPDAVKSAGETSQNVYFNGPVLPQSPSQGHRRAQSEIGTPGHRRTNSFQKLKTQMQKAWRGVSNLRDDNRPTFNPEDLANQKRQWYQLHSSKALLDQTKYKEPTSLFEHFIIVGLHPETDLKPLEEAFRRRKKWEMEMSRYEVADYRILRHRGPQFPVLQPQILFKYPPGKKVAMRPKDLAAFCFPGGVKARLLERSPSLSDLNELVYGQEHLGTDDSSFIFSFKVADDATLYGVCLHVSEIVQRPPGVLSTASPLHSSGGGSRFLVSAPRCYCLLTRVPFFELHFEMLNSMIAQERLKRITEFVSEMSLAAACHSPSVSRMNSCVSSPRSNPADWMASAIPVDGVMALTAAAAGLISDSDIASFAEPQSPDSVVTIDTSETSQIKEIERDGKKVFCYDDNSSEVFENHLSTPERTSHSFENGHASPEVTCTDPRIQPIQHYESCDSVFSSARSVLSDEVDDIPNSENDFGDDLVLEWAKEHNNDALQLICGYHSLAIPSRGSEVVFQPLEHLQSIAYTRPPVSALGLSEEFIYSSDSSEINARLAAAEEAMGLSLWTTATVCRILSLETIMSLLAGVLLEKQIVVICPNLGVLSAIVLSLLPMIRPFQWQSLLLPVLPGRMFDFLEAPVPFLVGIHSKPTDWKVKTSNLILVNIINNQVKICNMPALPQRRELMAQLTPIHATLAHHSSTARRHPVYKCNQVQAEAATKFLGVMRDYMESLCSDLHSHTITSVQSNSDRVSLLLKDSFIDSFSGRDRPFIKLFVDTQLFSVLSDSRLSSFENGGL